MNRPTRYEVTATKTDGTSYLVGYTRRRSMSGLLHVAQMNGEKLANFLGVTDNDPVQSVRGRAAALMIGPWTISFTGRTQLEAVKSPKPFFLNLSK